MTFKPFCGEIRDWRRFSFDIGLARKYYNESPGLGYAIAGTFVNHPRFGYCPGGSTSWVVAHNEETGEIETRNSHYRLVGPELEPVKPEGESVKPVKPEGESV